MPYFLILLIPLLIFLPFAAAIVYHLKKYTIEGDISHKLSTVFVLVAAALVIMSMITYLNINWTQFSNYTITISNNP